MTEIYHTTFATPIGFVKITATDAAIRSVLFMEGPEAGTVLSKLLQECIKQLSEYFSGERKVFDLPLETDGTLFQKKVWESLCGIPFGATVTYGDIANKMNNPKSIRAVGSANGKNPLSIIVPCHRVIGGNGALVGYSGELWRKKWLLEHEAGIAHGVQRLF